MTFNQSSAAGFRIAITTQANGNGNGVDGVDVYTGGSSLATATSSATNATVLSGGTVFYSFDVTNITAGDHITVNLFDPEHGGNFLTYGFTLDALADVPEPSTYLGGAGFLVVGLITLRTRVKG